VTARSPALKAATRPFFSVVHSVVRESSCHRRVDSAPWQYRPGRAPESCCMNDVKFATRKYHPVMVRAKRFLHLFGGREWPKRIPWPRWGRAKAQCGVMKKSPKLVSNVTHWSRLRSDKTLNQGRPHSNPIQPLRHPFELHIKADLLIPHRSQPSAFSIMNLFSQGSNLRRAFFSNSASRSMPGSPVLD